MLIISRSNGPTRAEAKKLIFSSISENREELAFITDYSYNKKIYSKTDKIFTSGKDRVTFDVSKYDISEECPYEHDVRVALYGMNFELTDYMKGLCKHEDGRTFRVAKVLKRDPNNSDLVKNFINSSVRASYKSKKVATLSRNMFDIITMSTFKGWTSCMDLNDGCNKEYVGNDIASGTLIIYLHDEKDVEIKSPICRILLRPYYHYAFGKLNLFYGSEAISYGTTNIDMENIGNDVAKFINQEISDKRYRKMKETFIEAKIQNNVYEDDISSTIIVEFKELDFNDIEIIRNFSFEGRTYSTQYIKELISKTNNKILLQNSLFYSGFDRKITSEDIDYLLSKDIKINNFAINYVHSAKNPHFDKEFALLIKDYFSPQKLFKFMIEKSSLTEKLSIDDGLFSGEDNKLYIDMINLRISSNFSEMRELSRIEMQILINIYFSYEIKSDALSCSYMKTLMKYKLNNERVPYRYSFRLNTDIISTIEEAFTYEEQCTLVECLDDGYFWVSNYYKFLSKFLILEKVYYRGVMECRYFKEYCENEVPMFKEAIDFNLRKHQFDLRKHQSDYGFDTTIALAS